jgi:hypothetical protein
MRRRIHACHRHLHEPCHRDDGTKWAHTNMSARTQWYRPLILHADYSVPGLFALVPCLLGLVIGLGRGSFLKLLALCIFHFIACSDVECVLYMFVCASRVAM